MPSILHQVFGKRSLNGLNRLLFVVPSRSMTNWSVHETNYPNEPKITEKPCS